VRRKIVSRTFFAKSTIKNNKAAKLVGETPAVYIHAINLSHTIWFLQRWRTWKTSLFVEEKIEK